MTISPLAVGMLGASIGLIPVAWLAILHSAGRARPVRWWLLATVWTISWAADMATLLLILTHRDGLAFDTASGAAARREVVWLVYPVSQAALVAGMFLKQQRAVLTVIAVTMTGVIITLFRDPTGPDIAVHAASWGVITAIVWEKVLPSDLRVALVLAFAAGFVAYVPMVLAPGWYTWGAYQSVRLMSVLVFCSAALKSKSGSIRRTLP